MKHVFQTMLISNNPAFSKFVAERGVQCIFVDIEREGKAQRQSGLDAVLSDHEIEDIVAIRHAIPDSTDILLRIDPIGERTEAQIEHAIKAGADIIMLPMVKSPEEVEQVGKQIDRRCRLIPLIETAAGWARTRQIAQLDAVDELYFGLNDLHLDMSLSFMFEPLAAGMMDVAANICHAASKPFGFGGIAQLNQGAVPGSLILSEHVRLGSTRVILSRTFVEKATTVQELEQRLDFGTQYGELLNLYHELTQTPSEELQNNHTRVVHAIEKVRQLKK